MIKRLLVNIAVAGIIFLMIIYTILGGEFSELNVNNSLFITGFVMASMGILTLTNVSKIFRSFNFAFKKLVFSKYQSVSYYDYVQQREALSKEKEKKPTGWAALVVGAVLIMISISMPYW